MFSLFSVSATLRSEKEAEKTAQFSPDAEIEASSGMILSLPSELPSGSLMAVT